MSESVKIGGIGKNPAIDQIQQLNAIDVGSYAAKRMQELLVQPEYLEKEEKINSMTMDFTKVNWKRTGEEQQKRHGE